jgi:gluconokinase
MSAEALANRFLRSYFTRVDTGIYVVMGVSGSGKSLIGSRFARALGLDFVEGDDFHPAGNIERMSSGIPLTDDDRAGWLRSLARRIRVARDANAGVVISCSALRRAYRDILREGTDGVRFIFLRGSHDLIANRIAHRGDSHFMPPSLLDSQLSILEEPSQDELVWVCDVSDSPEKIVADLVARTSDGWIR